MSILTNFSNAVKRHRNSSVESPRITQKIPKPNAKETIILTETCKRLVFENKLQDAE